MTDLSIGVVFPKTAAAPRRPKVFSAAEFGRQVESLGYESVWTSEGWGSDSFVELMEFACHTDEVRLGTSVVNVFSRSPAVLAMASASVMRASDGRVILGVGTGHPATIEGLHGIKFSQPLTRIRETIELIRAYTEPGETEVDYNGEIFHVTGYRSQNTPVPIYNAALGEHNRRLTGMLCDGWVPFNIPLPALEAAFKTLTTAAEAVDRDPDDITVAPWISAAVSDDPEKARRIAREHVASYVGRITDDTYKGAVAQAFPTEADRIANAWRRGDEDEAASYVTDEMVDALGVTGSPEDAREQLFDLIDSPVVDVPILSVPYLADDEMVETTIEELSPWKLLG